MDSWLKRDMRYLWHPYTRMKDPLSTPPVLIERAEGLKLYDDRGNFYYDTISSWWCNVHGHNHPHIKTAIKRQLDSLEHILFAGFTHRPAIELAERLVSIAPKGLTRVFFSDDGSTAVEAAIKISFQYWHNIGRERKKRFISLDYAYHGDTIGAMGVSGVGLFNELFSPLLFKSFRVPPPYCYRCPAGREKGNCAIECIRPLERILRKRSGETAAIILEPMILAAGGMIVYPKEYLRMASALAERYGVHLILDEVATGFGRTGRMFACEHAGVRPDIMCLSKGITAGYLPLGATLATECIYRSFYDSRGRIKTFYHGHTYTANPLSCSAALASLEVFEKEKTLDRIKRLIPVFHKGLEKFRALKTVGDVRYIGMIGALELIKDREKREPFGMEKRAGFEIYREGLKKGLILRPLGDIIYFYLPLCISGREINIVLSRAYDIIANFTFG